MTDRRPSIAHQSGAVREYRQEAVDSDTFLLIPDTVTDLDDFAENHDKYLVSIYEHPDRAAAIWRDRLKRHPYGDEGFVSISHFGHDLIAADLWDQVGGIWQSLVEAIEGFLATGTAEQFFPGQPAPIALRAQRSTVLLTIGDATAVVDPATFFPGVLDAAERFCLWVEEHIGLTESSTLEVITRVRSRLAQ